MQMHEQPQRSRWFQSRKTPLALPGFLTVGAFFLFAEHTAHVLGVLPFLIFLLCPLMVLFMHGEHGGIVDMTDMMEATVRIPQTSHQKEDSHEYPC